MTGPTRGKLPGARDLRISFRNGEVRSAFPTMLKCMFIQTIFSRPQFSALHLKQYEKGNAGAMALLR